MKLHLTIQIIYLIMNLSCLKNSTMEKIANFLNRIDNSKPIEVVYMLLALFAFALFLMLITKKKKLSGH
jgi:hypothetical protein